MGIRDGAWVDVFQRSTLDELNILLLYAKRVKGTHGFPKSVECSQLDLPISIPRT